jgi:hypothetical protein
MDPRGHLDMGENEKIPSSVKNRILAVNTLDSYTALSEYVIKYKHRKFTVIA